uniref:adhesion G-protein coupled receptor G6-like isoform X3 n=1 Tax=Styela clava TaxID=7725 RepID=UPI0019396F55|nr:adhesion G-protein coupled receptor G6-like isoform X3 [Styela clava]
MWLKRIVFIFLSVLISNIEALVTEGSGSSCQISPCQNGGYCIEGSTCVCAAGWTGTLCEKREGSGSICHQNNPCQNGGVCIEGGTCVCRTGWSGTMCEKRVDDSVVIIDANTGMMYTLLVKNLTFGDAVNECKKRFGRIISNVTDTKVKRALSMLHDKASQALGQLSEEALNQFWVIVDKYTDIFPQLTLELCTTSDVNGTISKVGCEHNFFSVVCAKPISGDCYPEISKGRCKSPKDMCQYNRTSLNCVCRDGFVEDPSEEKLCVDVDECSSPYSPCNHPITVCQNTQGAYRCGCSDGKQGNGVHMCGYVTTMEQRNVDFNNIPYLVIPNGVNSTLSMYNFEVAKKKIQGKLLAIFQISTSSIKKIFVKTMSPPWTAATVVYDVWSMHSDISPTSIDEFYNEAGRRGKLYWMQGSKPFKAPAVCTPSTLGLKNRFYKFSSANPGTRGVSEELCPDVIFIEGRNIATAECKTKTNSDGSKTAFYDYKTVVVIPCYISLESVNEMVENVNSTSTAEIAMRDLDSLTSDYTKTNNEMVERVTESMSKVANFVWTEKVDINLETMTSMVNVADNINKAQKYDRQMNGTAQLNATQRREIINSLERCSVHVITNRSETFTISTQSVIMQITNALRRQNSTSQLVSDISFNQVLSEESAFTSVTSNSCQPSGPAVVRSFIPTEAVQKAKKMKAESLTTTGNLPVSFVYFTDSEFFTPRNDKYEIKQVLSAQISNLELENLKDPVWFQLPITTYNNKNAKVRQYFKCSFLNEKTGEWLSDGCETIPGSDPPNCTCNHMTNFAVLVQTHEKMQEYSLEIVGKVCCLISIFGLLFMLLIHLYFPILRKSEIVKIHSHLGFCLMLSYIILLSSTERPKAYGLCIASAALLHFFLLSSWGWMVVECITMYKKLVSVFSKAISHYVTKAAATVYVISAVIVITTMVISVTWYDTTNYGGWITPGSDFFPSSYVSDRLCWLHSYSLIFGFLIPVAAAFVVSFSGAIVILWSITCGRKQVGSQTNPMDIRTYVTRAITVSVLLGLSWVFAIPLTLSDDPTVNTIFGWLFSVTNALQGFFMFLLFCVRRNDVRKLWTRELKNFFTVEDLDSVSASRGTVREETITAASNDNTVCVNSTDVTQSAEDRNSLVAMEGFHKNTPQNLTYISDEHDFGRLGKISSFHPISNDNKHQ